LRWLTRADVRVPIEIVAGGPKMIDVGVRRADRITFGLGADVDRLAWAVERVRIVAEASQRAVPSLGAFIHVAPTDDLRLGRDLLSGTLSVVARFSALHGRPVGPTADAHRPIYE